MEPRNEAYYGFLSGVGTTISERLKIEGGFGLFEQDQIQNVQSTNNPLYGEMITAMGITGQISFKSREDMDFASSEDLRLYQNNPDVMRDTYIYHPSLDGFGAIVQAEINILVTLG